MVDLVLLAINIILLVYLVGMVKNSREVSVSGKLGNVWIIAGFFFLMGLMRLMQGINAFAIIQTVMIMAVGVIYSQMRSGMSEKGIVMLGVLYPWKKIVKVDVSPDEAAKEIRVDFQVKKVSRFIYFDLTQEEAVDQKLALYEEETNEGPYAK